MASKIHDCAGKEAYDKKWANTSINYHKKHFWRILRCYLCPNCNFYHLTHTERYIDQELWKKHNAKHVIKKRKEYPKDDEDFASIADIW